MPRSSSGFSGSGGRGAGGGFGSGGGGSYHHHHHHYGGGFFFFPWHRPYYGGGLFSLLFLPIIILVFALIFLVSSIVTLISVVSQGGIVIYDPVVFDNKATAAYEQYFDPKSETYEDNLLIYFSTEEGYTEYHGIGIVGNNLQREILYMFDEGGSFEVALSNAFTAKNYDKSFDRNMYDVLTDLKIEASELNSVFVDKPQEGAVKDPVLFVGDKNLTDFKTDAEGYTTEGYTYRGLKEFTEATGINVVMIIDDAESIFGRTIPPSIIISGVISLGICIFAGVWIYKSVKASKAAKKQRENRNNGTDYNDPRYWN